MKPIKPIATALLAGALLLGSNVASVAAGNPSRTCKSQADMQSSHGGCVSLVNHDGVPTSAGYVAQCKFIASIDQEAYNRDVSANPQQYGFGGKIGSCIDILRKYHEGYYGHP